jgi:hypothetical protein
VIPRINQTCYDHSTKSCFVHRHQPGWRYCPTKTYVHEEQTWYITDDVRLTVAYNFINHFPEEAHENISRPEGLVYQFSKESHLQLGYMYLFQQQAAGNRYRKQNTIRLFYSHNFDLRKK